MTIGERIRALRDEREWTTAELERQSGVSRDQLSRIFNAHNKPSYETLGGLARAFGLTMAELFEGVAIEEDDLPSSHPTRPGRWAPEKRKRGEASEIQTRTAVS